VKISGATRGLSQGGKT